MSDVIFGKYRLLAEIGHGGMADVFLAVVAGPAGSGFSKLTVVKRLRPNLAEDPDFVAMLVDEARIAARLNHPNVVQTNEVGHIGAHYFLSMEYLDGQPLQRIQHRNSQVLSKEGRVAISDDLQYLTVVDTLAGLHHAHELADYDGTPLEIVHRDVTPHNVFVTYEGQVKVVDFGIAKAAGRASETRQGVVKGKVRYMAPEQAMGLAVDRRADVFSAGVMLWEVAAGRRMWKDKDDLAIVQQLIAGDIPTSPRSIKAEVPEEIDRICQKALAARPEDRYATAEDFRNDLEQYLATSGRLVDAKRRLGQAVAQLFADKRAELKAVIESQLSTLKARPSAADIAVVAESAPKSATSSITGAHGGTAATSISASADETSTSVADSAATRVFVSKTRRYIKIGAAAGVALLVLTGGAMALRKGSATEAATAKHDVSSARVEEVNIELVANPPSARIKLDGRDVGATFRTRVPRDSIAHQILVEADGFEAREESVAFEGDISRNYRLEPVRHGKDGDPSVARQTSPTSGPVAHGNPRWSPKASAAPVPSASPPPAAPPAPPATAESPPSPTPTATGTGNRRNRDIDKGDPWATGKEGHSP